MRGSRSEAVGVCWGVPRGDLGNCLLLVFWGGIGDLVWDLAFGSFEGGFFFLALGLGEGEGGVSFVIFFKKKL